MKVSSLNRLALLLLVVGFILTPLSHLFAQSPWGSLRLPRVQYGGGGDWYTDPTSIPNLLKAAEERLKFTTRPDNFAIRIQDADLFHYPMLYMTGHGNVKFEDAEISRLQSWLDNGGFLWVDDCYGIDRSLRREFKRLYPNLELAPIPPDHPIFKTVYDMPKGLPKIHEHDGKPPQAYGIFNKGRLVIFYTHETDIGCGLEDVGVHPEDTPEVRELALKMALNILVFAITQ